MRTPMDRPSSLIGLRSLVGLRFPLNDRHAAVRNSQGEDKAGTRDGLAIGTMTGK